MKLPGTIITKATVDFIQPEEVMSEPYNLKGKSKSDFQLGFIEKIMHDDILRAKLDALKGTLCTQGTGDKIKLIVEAYISLKLESENIPLTISELPFSIHLDHERIGIIFHTLAEIHKITIDPWPILASLYDEMCKNTWDWGKNQVVLLERAYLEAKEGNTTLVPQFINYPEDVKDFLYTSKEGCDYVDNERIARVGDADGMRKYMNQKDRGCCGVFDTCYRGKDKQWYLIGFNYGH